LAPGGGASPGVSASTTGVHRSLLIESQYLIPHAWHGRLARELRRSGLRPSGAPQTHADGSVSWSPFRRRSRLQTPGSLPAGEELIASKSLPPFRPEAAGASPPPPVGEVLSQVAAHRLDRPGGALP